MPAFNNFAASSGEHEIDLVRIPEIETLLNLLVLLTTEPYNINRRNKLRSSYSIYQMKSVKAWVERGDCTILYHEINHKKIDQ